ncbi:brachyurin [Teleopsis dalmanni]|uniref:brachyurin n=1 Tax=Teleopsis dalmanni TaxID=139649 RepID=UPI0018CD8F5F|nr:brachyurin [Teleopsis dalmanni]
MKLARLCAVVACATLIFPLFGCYERRNFHGYNSFDFWILNHTFINWLKRCRHFNRYAETIKTRIAGGTLAGTNLFPYQVGLLLLQAPKVYQCGGALISQNYVLTAAHCLLRATKVRAFVGSNLFADAATSTMYETNRSDFHIYEQYSYGGYDDIGLIYFKNPIQLSEKVQIIPLAKKFMIQSALEGETVTTSGWGRTSDNTTTFDIELYYIDVPVIPYQRCACYYLPGLVRERNHICTDGKGGRGSCDGDSGGPLTYLYNNVTYLIGLTSFGSASGCEIQYPSVFTRITTYLSWIEKKTGIKSA